MVQGIFAEEIRILEYTSNLCTSWIFLWFFQGERCTFPTTYEYYAVEEWIGRKHWSEQHYVHTYVWCSLGGSHTTTDHRKTAKIHTRRKLWVYIMETKARAQVRNNKSYWERLLVPNKWSLWQSGFKTLTFLKEEMLIPKNSGLKWQVVLELRLFHCT